MTKVAQLIVMLMLVLAPSVVLAQSKPALHITGKPIEDIKADIRDARGQGAANAVASASAEDQIIAQANQLGQKFIDDLTQAYAYASYKGADGQLADAAAAPCYAALIPTASLIVNGPPSTVTVSPTTAPPSEPGIVTKVEKLRIIRIALQSTSLKNACAPLVQDVQTQVTNVLTFGAGIARVLTGFGLAIP